MKAFWKKLFLLTLPIAVLFGGFSAPVTSDCQEAEAVVQNKKHNLNDYAEPPKTIDVLIPLEHLAADAEKLYSIPYDEEAFFEPATVYNHTIARQSIGLALASFNFDDTTSTGHGIEGTMLGVLNEIGFEDIRDDDYVNKETSLYTVGTAIAHKEIHRGDEEAELVVVAIRGGKYKKEWESNLTVDSETRHHGFNDAATLVTDRLYSYLSRLSLSKPLKIWIFGFSRAGAIANLTAANLEEAEGLNKEDIHAYTFAAPRAAWYGMDEAELQINYENIWNIVGSSDPITQFVPGAWNYGRYGHDRYLIGGEFDSTFASKYAIVQEFLAKEGISTYYNVGLNLRVRMLYGMLMEIAHNDLEFHEYLQPLLVRFFGGASTDNLLQMLRETLMEWKIDSEELTVKKDALVDYALGVIANLVTGRGFMEGQKPTSYNALRLLAHEHYPELYFTFLNALTEEEMFCANDSFSYITFDSDANIRVSLYDNEVLTIENGRKSLTDFAKTHQLDMTVSRFEGKTMLTLPHDYNYLVEYELAEGTDLHVLSIPYGRVYQPDLPSYSLNVDVDGPRRGEICRVQGLNATYQGTQMNNECSEFAHYLKIDMLFLNYRTDAFLMILSVLLVGVGLAVGIAYLIGAITKTKVPLIQILLGGGAFVGAIEAECFFWLASDFMVWTIVLKIVASLFLLALYIWNKDIKAFRYVHKTALPYVVLSCLGYIFLSVNILTGIILFAAAFGYLCYYYLSKGRLPKNAWVIFGLGAAALIALWLQFVRPLDPTSIACLVLLLGVLLSLIASLKQTIEDSLGAIVLTIVFALLATYLFFGAAILSSILFILLFHAASVLLILHFDPGIVRKARQSKAKAIEPANASE